MRTGDRFCFELHQFKSRASLIRPPICVNGQEGTPGQRQLLRSKGEGRPIKGHCSSTRWHFEPLQKPGKKKNTLIIQTAESLNGLLFIILVMYKQFQCFLIMFVNIYIAVTQLSKNAIFLQDEPGQH